MITQFIKFSLVGILNTAIHFAVFYALYSFMGVYHLLASAIGFGFAVTNSYFINKHWTFKSTGSNIRNEFSKFFIVNLFSLTVNLASMAILVEICFIHPPVAQLATIVITLMINFSGNKYWSFNGKA